MKIMDISASKTSLQPLPTPQEVPTKQALPPIVVPAEAVRLYWKSHIMPKTMKRLA